MSTVASGEFEGTISRDDQSIDYQLTYSGLQGTVTQAHIHVAQPSVNGSIVIWLCDTATNPGPWGPRRVRGPAPSPGKSRPQRCGRGHGEPALEAGELDEVIAAIRAGVVYANVHTNLSPGGGIRGQISASKRDRLPFDLDR